MHIADDIWFLQHSARADALRTFDVTETAKRDNQFGSGNAQGAVFARGTAVGCSAICKGSDPSLLQGGGGFDAGGRLAY